MKSSSFRIGISAAALVVTTIPGYAQILAAGTNPDSGSIGSRITVETPAAGYGPNDYFTFGTNGLSSKNASRASVEIVDGKNILRVPKGAKTGAILLHSGTSTRIINPRFTVDSEQPYVDPTSLSSTYYAGDRVFIKGTGFVDGQGVTVRSATSGAAPSTVVNLHLTSTVPDVTGASRTAYFDIQDDWVSGPIGFVTDTGLVRVDAVVSIAPKGPPEVTVPDQCVFPFETVEVSGKNLKLLDGGSVYVQGSRQSQFEAISNRSGSFSLYMPTGIGPITIENNRTATDIVTTSRGSLTTCTPTVLPLPDNACAAVGDKVNISGTNFYPGMEVSLGPSQRILLTITSRTEASFVVPEGAETSVPSFYAAFGRVNYGVTGPSSASLAIPCSGRPN